MGKLPALQFYPGDWRKDPAVQSLTFEQRGVWFEMLMIMHESAHRGKMTLNGKPMPTEAIANILGGGMTEVLLNQILTTLLERGVASREPETGIIYNRRMVRDEYIRQIRSQAGKKGGNPNLVKQNPTTQVKQNPTPSSSSSSSTTSSDVREELPLPHFTIADAVEVAIAFDHWESVTGRTVRRDIPQNRRPIEQILVDGYTVDDIKAVIDHKWEEWDTPEMRTARRLSAMLKPDKFGGYLEVAREWQADPYAGVAYEALPIEERMKIVAARKAAGTMEDKTYE